MGQIFCFFCAALLALMASSARAAPCPPFQIPTISVSPLLNPPALDTTRSLGEILAMSNEDREKFSSTNHEVPVGLTAASLKIESRFEVTLHQTSRSSDVCAQISHFDLRFGFDEATIFLARELPYGSCSYQTVMEHEQKHVSMDQYLVRTYAQLFPEMLREAITSIGMVQAPSVAVAQDKLRSTVKHYMRDLGYNLAIVRQRYQETIDTKDEYSRISKSCNGELSEMLRRNVPAR